MWFLNFLMLKKKIRVWQWPTLLGNLSVKSEFILNDKKQPEFICPLEMSFFPLIVQIVGNLLYYRYMNPAIVAPDGFDIIDMTAGGQINSDQRRNLGSVAKVLQHAASNKLFEGENEHLSSMNNYLSETYQEFRWEGPFLLKRHVGKWTRMTCSVPRTRATEGEKNPLWLHAFQQLPLGEWREKTDKMPQAHCSHPTPSILLHWLLPVLGFMLLMKHAPWCGTHSQYLEQNTQLISFVEPKKITSFLFPNCFPIGKSLPYWQQW